MFMRILSISAQKPLATGSGVYLTEVIQALSRMGHTQALVAGIYREDAVQLPEGVWFTPVVFDTEELPFPIVGMSDEMPYKSTRYRDMTPEMTARFGNAFLTEIEKTVEQFRPDLLLSHHLYLLTACVRERFPDHAVFGICHNTDLRQLIKTDLERDYIKKQIRKLDRVLALHAEQADEIADLFGIPKEKIRIVGTGYDHKVFRPLPGADDKAGIAQGYPHASDHCNENDNGKDNNKKSLIYVGKIAEKKGVLSLLHALMRMTIPTDRLQVALVGSSGNSEEYGRISAVAQNCKYSVSMPGRIDTDALVALYNKSDVFVLPSFSEGLPLVVIEALACGCRVVVTDLPGLRAFYSANVKGGDIRYVKPPAMHDADEADPGELDAFEGRLACALTESLQQESAPPADVSALTWDAVAEKILSGILAPGQDRE